MTEPTPDRLSAEDREILARMRAETAEAKKRPGYASKPITNPEKYGGPIGADGDGNIITYNSIDDVPPKEPLKIKSPEDPDSDHKPAPRHRS